MPVHDEEFVEEILRRSELNLTDEEEQELCTSTLGWACRNEIDRLSLVESAKFSGEYQRRLLGSMFSLIRFPLMTPSQLADRPIKLGRLGKQIREDRFHKWRARSAKSTGYVRYWGKPFVEFACLSGARKGGARSKVTGQRQPYGP
ncbi:hypothetical protein RvY_18691 [Ramazzottius varieornatus]|uniref:Uncharacterized protein n=1 Tax=Ramazzottius varieornatus TaxID=947166 RepID=A0A1D1WAU9_RAMVA|nr:hypothetical protein RvY_18691 [Ramazzottius varieornatus]